MRTPLHLLALSGSLRAGASNTALLQAAALLAPPGVDVTLFDGVGSLPHFNPDIDQPNGAELPLTVAELRLRVGEAGGLLISTPEYAHGLPGSFKNMLDWLVGSTEFPGKPVAILNASPYSVHAPAQLVEVLTTMSARLVPEASISLSLPRGAALDAAAVVANPEWASALRAALDAFVRAVRAG